MPGQLCKVLLHAGWIVFLCFCISIIRDFGECCESVPLLRFYQHKQYINITRILARVVQVDASLLRISKLVTSVL